MKYEISKNKYEGLIKELRTYFTDATQKIYEGRNKLKVIQYAQTNIVVKSFKIPHFINKIAYTFFRDSKAKKSYKHSLRIAEFTAEPIGYVEFFQFGLLYDSYYLCKQYKYDFTIREVLVHKDFKNREKIFDAFASFTHVLHNHHIEHLDYSPGNILIKEKQGEYLFKIIDVNRMKFRPLNNKARLENFSKLWAKDEDLALIIESYSKLIDMDKAEAFKIALKASQEHKNKKNFKKRLKGKKVVD